MDVTTISQMISTVGFPIACVIALGFFIYNFANTLQSENQEREEKLYGFITKTQAQLDEAQKTNAGFVEVLKTYRNDLDEIKNDVTIIKDKLE